jgi:flagellar hook protein FlgE
MGIYGAMGISVSGLNAQAYALEQISSNIANAQTTGFKRTDTSFNDLVVQSPPTRQSGSAVQSFSRATNGVQGDIKNAAVSTFMAINGDGFFVVEREAGVVDGQPLFEGIDRFTRRGDFDLDANGYFVNGAGYFLKGLPVDAQTGNISGSVTEQIRVTNDFLPASKTQEVILRSNLSDYPLTANADPDIANSELLDTSSFANDPSTGNATVVDQFVRANEATNFIESTISGGAITVFDEAGAPINVQMRWGKIDSTQSGGSDTWNLFYLENSNATGTDPMWRNSGQAYTFDATGQLLPAITSVNLPNLTVDGVSAGAITLTHGQNGITQFSDSNGNAEVTELRQDGYAAGELAGLNISEDGRVVASYSNGRTVDRYQVVLAEFNAVNKLQKLDGGAFGATQDSGAAIVSQSGGNIVGGSLENSNTDIADEFTKLIVTQQAYAAGTRIVSTGDEMLQEVLNMVR